MTGPALPVPDLTAAQQALIVVARFHLGLRIDELEVLLGALIPDATVPERARRYATVLAAVDRYDGLACGLVSPTEVLGHPEPGEDEDDRVEVARVMAWFEVTEAAMRAVPVVSVDQHAAQAIAVVAEQEPPAVAA